MGIFLLNEELFGTPESSQSQGSYKMFRELIVCLFTFFFQKSKNKSKIQNSRMAKKLENSWEMTQMAHLCKTLFMEI